MVRMHAGWLVDGTGAPPLKNALLTIEAGRIASIEAAQALDQPLEPEVLDYRGKTVLPGLIDMHSHLTLAGDGRTYEQMVLDPDEMMVLTGVQNALLHLRAGVTTLRDTGARNRTTFILREAMNRGYIVGPRMLLSGRPVTCSGGHFHWCGSVADGEEEIRREVRKLVAEGADFIKLMATGGGTAGTDPRLPSYSVAELKAAVEAAHYLGRATTAHCRAKPGMVNAVQAGLDCMEHAEFLDLDGVMRFDQRIAEQIAADDIYLSPTLQAGGYHELRRLQQRQDEHGPLHPDEQRRLEQLQDHVDTKLDHFRRFLELGLKDRLLAGTDAGPFDVEFGRIDYCLHLMVRAGLTPLEAIRASTSLPARASGLSEVTGTLCPGKAADILVVDGNAAADIRCISQVHAVVKGGELVA